MPLQALTHDANGNLTGDGTTSYTWNARNQLSAMTGASFAYDGFGRRMRKTVGATTTDFLYDGLNPVQELEGGTPTANLLTGLGIDEYFTRTDTNGARALLSDALGSTLALADDIGSIQTEYTYEPFGQTSVSGPPSSSSFQFTGRENDGTGLHYYRARYYHPQLQRFLGEDPLEFEGGDLNLYAYTLNDPVNLTDPTGHHPLVAGCLVGAAMDAGLTYVLSGRKPTLGTLAKGCASGMIGVGIGKTLTAVADAVKAVRAMQASKAAAAVRLGEGSVLRKVEFGDGLRHALTKHITGDGPLSLRTLDPGGNLETWLQHIIRTAQSGAGRVRNVPGGQIMEVTAQMSRAGGGVLNVGVAMFRKTGSAVWKLTTILTRQ